MGQAHYVYGLIGEALGRYGCTMRDVLHQTMYLVEPAHFPALERIATLHYGVRFPPTTLVPIRGASPFREARLEIEVSAHASA
jgi:enamine deaminase RidA (YjgF/YER057c/UK114 family)